MHTLAYVFGTLEVIRTVIKIEIKNTNRDSGMWLHLLRKTLKFLLPLHHPLVTNFQSFINGETKD
jgi:hypothetical protein